MPVDRLCQHSGVCINAGNSHHCQCPLGYTGSYCEEQLDECSSNPCQHGATCSDFIGGYRCEVRQAGTIRDLPEGGATVVINTSLLNLAADYTAYSLLFL